MVVISSEIWKCEYKVSEIGCVLGRRANLNVYSFLLFEIYCKLPPLSFLGAAKSTLLQLGTLFS